MYDLVVYYSYGCQQHNYGHPDRRCSCRYDYIDSSNESQEIGEDAQTLAKKDERESFEQFSKRVDDLQREHEDF